MLLALIISFALLVLLIAWQTHGSFSRTAFWWVAGTVVAINAISYAIGIGGGAYLIDMPGLFFVGPLWDYALNSPVMEIALTVACVAISVLAWGYIAGRITGVVIARRKGIVKIVKGFCSVCGYNLTGNASGVCPECGTKISS